MIEKAKDGERSEVIFMDILKDETLKKSKVDIGKTRLISASPLDYSIVCRMYFLSFSMALMNTRLDNGVAVGTNVYSDDW